MTLTLILVTMTLAVVAALAVPLLKPERSAPGRSVLDLAVYRDQLEELKQDEAEGLIPAEQALVARTEIERRLLASADGASPDRERPRETGRRLRLGAAMLVIAGLPLCAFLIYGKLGAPKLPGQPFAERVAEDQNRTATIRGMIDRLAERLKSTPDDVEGWTRLASSLRVIGETERARDAATHVVALRPHEVDPLLLLAQIQLDAAKEDSFPADFIATMKRVLALDPGNAPALYYLGSAAAQNGDSATARRLWTTLLAHLPAEAPERDEVKKQLDALPAP